MKKRTQSNWNNRIIIFAVLIGSLSCYAQNTWQVPGDYPNIQSALDSTNTAEGDIILVGPGEFEGAVITKSITLMAQSNTVVNAQATNTTTTGVGFYFPGNGLGSGSTIQGFTFTNLSLPILSLGADDVIIHHNFIHSPEQGITSVGGTNLAPLGGAGNRWIISHNHIFQPASYGIIIEEVAGNELTGNMVTQNTIIGTNNVEVATNASVTGIAFIGDANLGSAFRNNAFVYNRVTLTNSNAVLPSIGILLWQRNASTNSFTNTVVGNLVANNTLNTGQTVQVMPAGLEEGNRILQTFVRPGTVSGTTPETAPNPAPGPVAGEDPQRAIDVAEGTITGALPAADPEPAPEPVPGEDPDRP